MLNGIDVPIHQVELIAFVTALFAFYNWCLISFK